VLSLTDVKKKSVGLVIVREIDYGGFCRIGKYWQIGRKSCESNKNDLLSYCSVAVLVL